MGWRLDNPRPMPGGALLRNLLAHPLMRGVELDDPRTTVLRRDVIRQKAFLCRIYREWYAALAGSVPAAREVPGRVLELGSGAGFLRESIPPLITSEVFHCPGVDVVMDAQRMPLSDGSLRAVVMSNVFHHLPNARRFLSEAARCVRRGGVIAMIEPWYTPWSNLIYTRLHHEPFHPNAPQWEFATTGPLSGANEALAWIVFERDRQILEREFPQWRVERVTPMMPLRYLLSGGVSMRTLVPDFLSTPLKAIERLLGPRAAMFAHVVVRRSDLP